MILYSQNLMLHYLFRIAIQPLSAFTDLTWLHAVITD